MIKRYLPYVLLYVLGVASAWGLFQFTQSSGNGTAVASAAEPNRSVIRSAKSRRPVSVASRAVANERIAEKPKAVQKRPAVQKRRVAEKKRVAARKPARKPSNSTTRLRSAVAKGDQRAVKRLLKSRKRNVDAVDKRGRSLLMTAVGKGHSDVARLLIKAGADVDGKARDGDTPLMVAARAGDPVIVHMLLEGGADIDAKNRKGQTARILAKKGGHDVVYEFIADEVQRRGKQRSLVVRAQDLLNKLGYKLGSADGVVGPKTTRAVRRFQKSHRIRVDGRITPALISALQRKAARRTTGRTLASRRAAPARSTAKLPPARSPDADQDAGESGDKSVLAEAKSWLGRTTSSVSSFLKSNQEATDGRTRLCEAAQDRWVQDGDGNWIECTNVPQF